MWLKRRHEPDERPERLSARLLVWCSVVTVLGFSAVCGSVMIDMRNGEEALARQTSENLVSTIDADISRNIELYDLSLRAVATNMIAPEIALVSKPLRHLILFDHAATARHFGAIEVLDKDGNVTIDSATLDPASANRGDEEYFQVHRDNPDAGLFISRPGLHRGNYAIVLSRRITGKDGSFQGVVTGSLRFSYFHDLFDPLQLQKNDSIFVLRRDGVIIMRVPFDLDVIGRDLSKIPAVKQTMTERSGSVRRVSAVDGVERLYVWRDNTRPLIVVVGKSWSGIFDVWHKQVLRIGGVMLALIAFVIVATLIMTREIKRRARAEDRLEELAITDPLTGLRNRRQFDRALTLEWQRALRTNAPLALLMIDADHFKTFNDMFGHQAGDHVLVRIAATLSDAVRRPGDCAARYGGEEFAVLLSGATEHDAWHIAETIRIGVEHLSADKWATTVSIGVASTVPNEATEPAELLEAADKALYEAKSRGRNQSFVASGRTMSLVA